MNGNGNINETLKGRRPGQGRIRGQMHTRPFAVPEGYFESLGARLSSIPRTQTEAHGDTGLRRRFLPYPVLAACTAAAVLIVAVLVTSPWRDEGADSQSVTFEQLLYADLVPLTDPYAVYESSYPYPETQSTLDDILNSLMAEGVSAETIRYESEQQH